MSEQTLNAGNTTAKENQYANIVNDLVQDYITSNMPWHRYTFPGERQLYVNPASGNIYKGINALNLSRAEYESEGPNGPHLWMTARQIKETGTWAQAVLDNLSTKEKTPVFFYKEGKEYEYKKVNEQTGEESIEKRRGSYATTADVYYVGYDVDPKQYKTSLRVTAEKAYENAEAFIEASKSAVEITVFEEPVLPENIDRVKEFSVNHSLPVAYDIEHKEVIALPAAHEGIDKAAYYQSMINAIVKARVNLDDEKMRKTMTDDQSAVVKHITEFSATYFISQRLGIGTNRLCEALNEAERRHRALSENMSTEMFLEGREKLLKTIFKDLDARGGDFTNTNFAKAFASAVKKGQAICDELTRSIEQNLDLNVAKLPVINKELSAADKGLKVYEPNVTKMGHYQGYVVGRGNGDTYVKVQARQSGNYYLVKDKSERLHGMDKLNHEIEVQYSKNGKAYVKDLTVERARNRDKGNSIAD